MSQGVSCRVPERLQAQTGVGILSCCMLLREALSLGPLQVRLDHDLSNLLQLKMSLLTAEGLDLQSSFPTHPVL